jgi:hypothetical protein
MITFEICVGEAIFQSYSDGETFTEKVKKLTGHCFGVLMFTPHTRETPRFSCSFTGFSTEDVARGLYPSGIEIVEATGWMVIILCGICVC